jgi:hypothetical protein
MVMLGGNGPTGGMTFCEPQNQDFVYSCCCPFLVFVPVNKYHNCLEYYMIIKYEKYCNERIIEQPKSNDFYQVLAGVPDVARGDQWRNLIAFFP